MKKHYIKKLFATVAVLLCCTTANAHDFEVDGIYYKILSASDLTAQVTYKGNSYDEFTDEYSGEVIIPSTVSYKSKTLTVASIGKSTFQKCSGLTSITIPNSVTSIENNAFNGCTSLKELHIEDGTETLSLGYNYYASSDIYGGDGLYKDCPLENLYLGRNLSYYDDNRYGDSPFKYKRTLTSITIGNSVTSIGRKLFYGCESLTSVTIPNSVTSIKYQAFEYCSGLTSITIPNSVTSIGNSAFRECLVLTSVTIGNNVTSIGTWTFRGCSALTSVVIGNSVTSIGEEAFVGCTGLTNIQLLSKTPPTVESGNFAESQYTDITLYVPVGSLETYQTVDTWKNFWDIREEGTTETPEEDVKKCAIPVITYNNSSLDITTETDGAEIHTNITCNDANSYNSSRIDLTETYSITTYATKSGYLNSEIVTATLCWIAVNGSSEENGIIEVEAMPVLITCNNGTINISGGKDGAEVVIYTTSGVAVGNATITNGNATISTELAMGEIAVVNIAGKGIKIVMQ